MAFSFTAPDIAQFSEGQTQAFKAVVAGRSVCISGPAGSGKSTLLNALRRKFGAGLSVTASTGIAALNVGGSTLHSFTGIGLGEGTAEELAMKIKETRKRAQTNIIRCEVLAIEEISMVSDELFGKLNRIFQIVRRDARPFGGIQLILLGDFLQLPPVDKKREGEDDRPPLGFAFESPAWKAAGIKTIILTKVYRQENQAFADALGDMRVGATDSPRLEQIFERNNFPLPNDGIRPVKIGTHNAEVDRINREELELISGKEFIFRATDKGTQPYLDRLDKDCLAPKELRLKLGAQVMLLKNLSVDEGLANGSLGTVTQLTSVTIQVKFTNGRSVFIEPQKWEVKCGDSILAERSQHPLRLAYAITSHKVQGMTLDRIECQLARTFEFGQAYVAISRVKTIDGLFLRGFSAQCIMVHPRAVMFYQRESLAVDEAQTTFEICG